MKKNLFVKIFLLLCVSIFSVACIVDDPVAGPIIDGGGGSDDPDLPIEHLDIAIDGDFSDWDAIPGEELVLSEVPADAFYETGKRMMACADKTYIYLYVEFLNNPEQPVQIMHLYLDSDMAFDSEGKPTTGYGNPAWTNDGADLLFESYVVDEESGEAIPYDPTVFSFTGEPLSANWDGWAETIAPGMGICNKSAHVVLPNGNTAFEMTILRSAVPGLGTKFRLGVALQYDWSDIAFLPAGSEKVVGGASEHGPVENLLVGAKKTIGSAAITLDGAFDDWDALPAEDLFVAQAPANPIYAASKLFKVASSADYLYLYVEYDPATALNVGILDLFLDVDVATDAAGNVTTGTGNWSWANNGSDVMFQGTIEGWDPEGFLYTGTPLAGEWAWNSVLPGGSGAVTTSSTTTLDNGNKAIEVGILRSAIPNLGKNKKIRLGMMLEKGDWSGECGVLPALPAKDGASGPEFEAAPQMKITLF